MIAVHRDSVTAAFFDATAHGRFLLRRCPVCDARLSPHAERCACGSEPDWTPASGRGRVVTWSVVHHRDTEPTLAGVVELDEGPWWWTGLTGFDPADDLTGQEVEVYYVPTPAETIPLFRSRLTRQPPAGAPAAPAS